MEKLKSFLKQHWMPVVFLLLIITICVLELRRRKIANEVGACPNNCCDCGPGGIAGGVKVVESNFDANTPIDKRKIIEYEGPGGKYIISEEALTGAEKDRNIADTLSKFKSIFNGNETICRMEKLIQKGNEKKILIMGSNVTHTMEFNPRRVIVEEMNDKCIGPGCHTTFLVKSIG